MSSIAVFIALSGGAYAAVKTNSIGSRQIKPNAVKNKDLANNAVTSPKVADGSLAAADFAPGELLAGPTGPEGPQGPAGTVDTSNYYDKAASDARFLGTGATAANSDSLGGLEADIYPTTSRDINTFSDGLSRIGFARRTLAAGSGTTTVLSIGLFGAIDVSCANPAQATITYRNSQGTTQQVWIQNMVSGAFEPFAVVAAGASTTGVTTSTVIGSMARYQFIAGEGSTSSAGSKAGVFDVTTLTTGSNTCLVQAQSQTYRS
jgi:hypothetical protein